MRNQSIKAFKSAQKKICQELEQIDGKAQFESDEWIRPDSKGGYGGGGLTRIIKNGGVFERGGVNFSAVEGTLPESMCEKLLGRATEEHFFATGISLVLHPHSPMIPTTHSNFRYLEVADKRWFGGGMDLTPYYFFEEDAVHFHQTIKDNCDAFDSKFYPDFKKQCDKYFYLPHRGETRGIGGAFYDYLGKDEPEKLDFFFELSSRLSLSFLEAYLPIVFRRKEVPFTEQQKQFQLLRRGRYVEFNLLYDRGTQFGLKTGGRTESILMSLPPEVKWDYCFEPKPGTQEAELLEVLRNPRAWVS